MASKVATIIERERIAHDWDYRELAKQLGVSVSTAHDWANGEHDPNLKSLRKIARRLKLNLAELVS